MNKSNIFLIFMLVVILSAIILFTSREGITGAVVTCVDCEKTTDCQGQCYDFCLKKIYDKAEASGYNESNRIMCKCNCQTYLKSIINI